MSSRYAAIVVGAGHNGLTTACYLAKAGLNVLVVEKSDWIGGAAVSRELEPGWTYSNCSYVCSLLRPEIVRDLDLPRFGLQVAPYESGATFTADGGYFAYMASTTRCGARCALLPARRRQLRALRDAVMRQCRFIRPLLLRTPPDPVALRPRDMGELLFLGLRFHDVGQREMGEAIRFWTMSIGDFLDQFVQFRPDLPHGQGAAGGCPVPAGVRRPRIRWQDLDRRQRRRCRRAGVPGHRRYRLDHDDRRAAPGGFSAALRVTTRFVAGAIPSRR